jgi:hypothetical protein
VSQLYVFPGVATPEQHFMAISFQWIAIVGIRSDDIAVFWQNVGMTFGNTKNIATKISELLYKE